MKVPLSVPGMTDEMKKSVMQVLDSHRYIKGPKVSEFEGNFAKYCGAQYG